MTPEEWEARYPDPEVRAHKRSLVTGELPRAPAVPCDVVQWFEDYYRALREGGLL